jgi:hypothetical protein
MTLKLCLQCHCADERLVLPAIGAWQPEELACKNCLNVFMPDFALQIVCQACRSVSWQAWQKHRRKKRNVPSR